MIKVRSKKLPTEQTYDENEKKKPKKNSTERYAWRFAADRTAIVVMGREVMKEFAIVATKRSCHEGLPLHGAVGNK